MNKKKDNRNNIVSLNRVKTMLFLLSFFLLLLLLCYIEATLTVDATS